MPPTPLVDEILHSGQLSYGKYGKEFERSLSQFTEASNVLVTNTFNMAILVTLSTLGVKIGDVVIASPMACLASTQPLVAMGLTVKWADVNPKTGTLCPDSVKKILQKEAKVIKAIIHNHFCGYVGFIDEINSLGHAFGIPVIDDCIEAFGSEYKGKKLGNVGTDVTVFSFGAVRIPNTLDGGAIIFKNTNLYEKSLLVRDLGIDRSNFRDELGEINAACDIKLIGHSATPNELSSYIGICQMGNAKELIACHQKNAVDWKVKLENNTEVDSIIQDDNCKPNYWVYGVLAKKKRDIITKFRKSGFYASGVHLNNNLYSVFDDHSVLKGVNEFYEHFVALPCGWWINTDSI